MAFFAFGVYLVLWAFVAGSIVVTFTSVPGGGLLDAAIRGPGRFYLETVATLREFAVLTTIPPRWTDVGYGALSMIPLTVHFFVTGVGVDATTAEQRGGPDASTYVLLVGTVLATTALVGASLLGLGAQLLAVSLLAVGVAVLTTALSLAVGS